MKLNITTAPKRNSRHWRSGTIEWEEILAWMDAPAPIKEAGNYVLGVLRETAATHPNTTGDCVALHRRKDAVVSRCALTLDVDHPGDGFLEQLPALGYTVLWHTTFSSVPWEPRYRLIIPLLRAVAPDEYITCATAVMATLGTDSFDPGSTEPERYMFKPGSPAGSPFSWAVVGSGWCDPDVLLDGFEDDLSDKPMPKPSRTKRDPFELEGRVGAFNRAYRDINELISAYDLPYEADAVGARWHLVGARSQAGLGMVADGLVYSHHAGDPAFNKTCSAFDLVRLHRFSELDEGMSAQTPINRLPSYTAMLDLAAIDPRVTAEIVGADFRPNLDADADDDDTAPGPNDWKMGLSLNRLGRMKDEISNWDLVRANDPVFRLLSYNELGLAIEALGDLPWRSLDRGGPAFTATDRAEMYHHIEREYKVRPSRGFMDELIDTTAMTRYRNPLVEYLTGLVWDGQPRVEECLPGVRPTKYTRMVARKSLVAAVARMLDPGVKWDHTLILFGPEGLGKSYWVERLSRGYTATLARIGDKDTLLAMQRSWIMVSDEGHSLKKADADEQKEFLTRTTDVFRMPYEREILPHKRHCVIWGSTNDEVFLRNQEGNRRFLIVHCEAKVDFSSLTDAYVDQLWAEAVVLYRAGEQLYLDDTQSFTAVKARERFTEEDATTGFISEFLERLVPEDWDTLSSEARRVWLQDAADGHVKGTRQITQTCSAQIWVEVFGRRFGEHKRTDLLEISQALKRLPGWRALPGRHRVPNYGPQLVYERVDADLL